MEKIIEMLSDIRPEFDFKSSKNFVDDGYLDSFDIVTFVDMMEEYYKIKIDGMDIIPENFGTVESIAELIKKSGGEIAS